MRESERPGMLDECDVCGGPRVNGMAIEEVDGEWRLNEGAPDGVREGSQFVCRACAMERIGERDG